MIQDWLAKRGKALTPLLQSQQEQLDVLDERCRQCQLLPVEEMLCNGFRPTFDEKQSDFYGYPRITGAACNKLVAKRDRERTAGMYDRCGIPPSMIQQLASQTNPLTEAFVKRIDGQVYVNGTIVPTYIYEPDTMEINRIFWMLTVASIKHGVQAKWVNPEALYKGYKKRWSELHDDLVTHCDWLMVRHAEYKLGADFKRDAFMSAIRTRILDGMPTIITLGQHPQPETMQEKELFEEIQTWERFPQQLRSLALV